MPDVLNKTMDRGDLDTAGGRLVTKELDELLRELRERRLPVSSWYGEFDLPQDPHSFERINRGYGYTPLDGAEDDRNFPWFLYWEIAWLVLNNDFKPGDRLLDMGGSCSLFSYYLASKGVDVTTVDLRPELVERANEVAERTGWSLRNQVMDMRHMELADAFDHITSVCVFEHIPMSGRIEVSRKVRDLLREGGTFSITFDYLNPSRFARIDSNAAVHEQFVRPSGLSVRANPEFHDNGQRHLLHPYFHPVAWRTRWKTYYLRKRDFGLGDLLRIKRENDYTFGALFLEKRAATP